ncbi:hypothetical protein AVEN_25068-1 [Araneus ventricosus]|uniref:Uncharacterized protein n=1 Tax=Araneus ventricosus TaxID=182803 RepID=A0A4Y2Q9A1_ARAVE|nr:hypothetical protein AVEN_25068-1 [Araneus ventricosus]
MINKPREGNQLKRLQLRSGKTSVISTTTEACTSPMRGGFTLLVFPLSVWVLVGSGRNEEVTPIYIWMNSARAELHLFSILYFISLLVDQTPTDSLGGREEKTNKWCLQVEDPLPTIDKIQVQGGGKVLMSSMVGMLDQSGKGGREPRPLRYQKMNWRLERTR